MGRKGNVTVIPSAEYVERDETNDEILARLNSRYAFVMIGGKARILKEHFSPIINSSSMSLLSPHDFEREVANVVVKGRGRNGKSKRLSTGKWWLEHPNRRELKGIVFDPAKDRPGYFNLWTGFAVEPAPEVDPNMIALVIELIGAGLCDGDTDDFNYFWKWWAHMFQHPADKPGVAVVLPGARGVGKSSFGRINQALLGRHAAHIGDRNHFLGKYLMHMADKLFVFADECFWAGDKKQEGLLKSLITEPSVMVEEKYQPVIKIDSFQRFAIASNEEWVVPAGLDERRFFIPRVGTAFQNDHTFFAELWHQLDNGGAAHLLAALLQEDLTGFNVRAVPNTEGLTLQKLNSAAPLVRFVLHYLTQPEPLGASDAGTWDTTGRAFVGNDSLYKEYRDHHFENHFFGQPLERSIFFKGFCGTDGFLGDIPSIRPGGRVSRVRGRNLPPRFILQERFAKKMGASVSTVFPDYEDFSEDEHNGRQS